MRCEKHLGTFRIQYFTVHYLYLIVCGKVKLILERTMKAQAGSRDIALLFL